MSTPPPTMRSSARRSVAAALVGLLVPGAGHALVGRGRTGLIFLVPLLLLAAAVLGAYAGGGGSALFAFVLVPGVLPLLALANVALAFWRLAAAVDTARLGGSRGLAAAIAGPAALVLVLLPHAWLGSYIASTSDFLDSVFYAGGPEVTAEPIETPPPDWTFEPEDEEPTLEPSVSVDPSATPGPTRTPRPPQTAGIGNLPGLNVSVPWQRPGAIPWGDDGRFDLLLLGSDAGAYRWSRRMDVMLLVEVDVATGKVAMIGLPRNLYNVPFPPGAARDAVPCGCFQDLFNALYVEATLRHPNRWPGEGAVAGIGAVRSVVSELTGRPIDAVLVADLWGVIKVVDAMGGIDIDVPTAVYDEHYPDPVSGPMELYIPAGNQHLDGRLALAYARSRHSGSDYTRMSRQQTLLLALREQIDGSTILNAPALFQAAKGFVWTDLPRDSLPNLVGLFSKARSATVKHLRIVPPTYAEWLTPAEITEIRNAIAKLLGVPPPPTPSPSPAGSPSASPSPSPSAGATPSSSPGDTPGSSQSPTGASPSPGP